MKFQFAEFSRRLRTVLSVLSLVFAGSLIAQEPVDAPPVFAPDETALILARRYLEGGEGARVAVVDALHRMGWGIRNHRGDLVTAPPAGTATGLALRDYELEELLWKPGEQPTIRLISFAQALAVPFEDADPEDLAQDLVETLRKSAESDQPQQRFWARFIIALGRVSSEDYDLLQPAPAAVVPPSPAQMKSLQQQGAMNPLAILAATQPTPVWASDDPVLAPSPRPERDDDDPRISTPERDELRSKAISDELGKVVGDLGSSDSARREAAQQKMEKLSREMGAISNRMNAANLVQMSARMKKMQKAQSGDFGDDDGDEDDENRFTAEWRDQPLSLLQISLITRVLSADLRLLATRASRSTGRASVLRAHRHLPFAMITLAQAAPAPAPTFSGQFTGAIGDIWATAAGGYTSEVLEHHLPENKFNKGVAVANTLIAWYKTIMSVAQQNISIDLENAPLVRTKNRSPGSQRTARAKVVIDFPKSDVLKAIRAAANITSVDLQLPDGGPVPGAKVTWRLREGSYNNKYQTAKGGWEYKPELAVVQFAQGAGYVSTTNDAGEATITIEGVPQKKVLPNTVRPYPRRAAIAVEVTIKVGNLTQDLNDAISLAMGGPVEGALTFVADMVLRTSFFFVKSHAFEVTDWKEPAWQGEFEIIAKASGSKREKGEKGGPDVEYTWKMDRYMEGRLHTPDWEEENEQKRSYENEARHKLEVDGDRRYFRLNDSSSSRTRNSHNRYEATGPLQIQPGGYNQLQILSRAEPSGSAELMFTGPMMQLEIRPFFGAECLVKRSERTGGRSSNKAGPEYLSLLGGISPETFTIIEQNDGSQEFVEGTKTFDYTGSLPHVPSFDVKITVNYRLWKNGPPPKNKGR